MPNRPLQSYASIPTNYELLGSVIGLVLSFHTFAQYIFRCLEIVHCSLGIRVGNIAEVDR